MSPSPPAAPGHSEDFEQLAGLAALRVLEGDEQAAFEAHAAECARCRTLLAQDRQVVAQLTRSVPEMDPSPGFKQRLMARAAAELQAEASPQPSVESPQPITFRPRPAPRVVAFWRRSTFLMPLAAAFVVLVGALGTLSYMNQVVASYALQGSVSGSATVLVHRSGAAELDLRGLADPPPGSVYEAWVIRPNAAPVPSGTSQRGQATLSLPQPVRGATVAVTIEPGPVSAPTTKPILAGEVE